MKIKQELLDKGFTLYYGEDIELIMHVLVWLENNTEILWCNCDYPTVNVSHALKTNDLLVLKDNRLVAMDEEYYRLNYTKDILQYDDLWEYDLDEHLDNICEVKIDRNKLNRLLNSKQQIVSLILDAQLSSNKRFDDFIDSLPVENEMLIEFIFGAEDEDLLLSELFDVLGYLGYEMNIIGKDGE